MKNFIRFYFLFSLIIVAFSCSEDDSAQEDDSQLVTFSTKEINVSIVLPNDSNLNPDELKVSSLFSLNREFVDGSAIVEVFDNDAMELIYVTNAADDLVMMKYINPINQSSIEIDSETSAQGLVLMHPWVMHLSAQARQEALQEIMLLPEYEAFESSIIQAINSGTLDPLASQSVIDAVGNIIDAALNRVEQETLPLLLVADNNTISVTNKRSSMAYSLQLYDENELPVGDSELVNGINKKLFSWSNAVNLLSGNFDIFQPTNIEFPVPNENQSYTLKANSWEGKAQVKNSLTLFSNIIGIVSTTLKDILDNAECFINSSNVFVGLGSTAVQALLNEQISNSEMIRQLITAVIDNGTNIISAAVSCSDLSFGSGFEELLKKYSYIGNFESGSILLLNAIDISDYDSQIEFCFQNTDQGQFECESLAYLLQGDWNLVGVESNDPNEQEVGCPATWSFSETQITLVDYEEDINDQDGYCSLEETFTSSYVLDGNFIIENSNGVEYNYEILELTETTLKVRSTYDSYYLIDTYKRLLVGSWNLVEVESNDPNEQEVGCPAIWTFSDTEITLEDYEDDVNSAEVDCDAVETSTSTYVVEGINIIETINGTNYSYEILELTGIRLKVKSTYGSYFLIDTYQRL